MNRDVDAGSGPSITAGVDCATPGQEAYIEDLGLPDAVMWLIEGMLANENPLRNLVRWGELLLDDRLRIPGAAGRITRERERLLGGGRTRRFLPYLGMCEDAADGRFVLDGQGRLDLKWDPRVSERNLLELEDAMRKLSEALGGVYIPSPLWAAGGRGLLTAHPLGGCANVGGSFQRGRRRAGSGSWLSGLVCGRWLDRADGAVTKPDRDDQRARGTGRISHDPRSRDARRGRANPVEPSAGSAQGDAGDGPAACRGGVDCGR